MNRKIFVDTFFVPTKYKERVVKVADLFVLINLMINEHRVYDCMLLKC